MAVLGRRESPELILPIALGALVPDAPMFLFYAIQKARGIPESVIWSQSYYEPGWQAFFDLFNSIPFALVGLIIARILRDHPTARWAGAFCASVLVHTLGDLPLHHDDGHRHFFPFSDWRYSSPVSYWDPHHHGGIVSILEMLAVVFCAILLIRRFESKKIRWGVGAVLASYVAYGAFVFTVWM